MLSSWQEHKRETSEQIGVDGYVSEKYNLKTDSISAVLFVYINLLFKKKSSISQAEKVVRDVLLFCAKNEIVCKK